MFVVGLCHSQLWQSVLRPMQGHKLVVLLACCLTRPYEQGLCIWQGTQIEHTLDLSTHWI
jgi:hypothetical protein